MSSNINSFDDLHSKVKKLFNNPNINFFIIMCLILLISCYTLINTSLRFSISSFISNPVIILIGLIIVILVGFYNINIAILILLLLFVILFGASIFNNKSSNYSKNYSKNNLKNSIENFTDNTTNDNIDDFNADSDDESADDSDDESADEKNDKTKVGKSTKDITDEENIKTDDKISNIKNVILGTLNNYKNNSDNEYKKGLLENKQIILNSVKKMNNNNNSTNSKKFKTTKSKQNSNNNSSKENFKTVDTRSFDPSKEEDTNLLITKEILTDMINRIEYNYESNKYLKKYIKHRIEEIIDMNKLLEEDE